ncbi:hypothetical protein BJD12_10910 [Xanthomonas vesicatoria ATCC 35937]|nr:hypothetical protein BJD12_10910 [Xanthomonas vesicatoria ATCC 35937]KTF32866.1 hypothetical protein LMG920_11655 [Xanthomonas vesicatoria]KTF38433.1 hypothetical protein LMG919_02955 [Xanthomonas vesicatoria]
MQEANRAESDQILATATAPQPVVLTASASSAMSRGMRSADDAVPLQRQATPAASAAPAAPANGVLAGVLDARPARQVHANCRRSDKTIGAWFTAPDAPAAASTRDATTTSVTRHV